MIIKIKSHKGMSSIKKLLEYMINDKDRLFDDDGKSFALTHNLKGDDLDSWVKQYKENEGCRQRKRTDSVILTHEIISFHREDAQDITLDKLEDISREYIRQRNPAGMMVAVPHFDKEHFHVHLAVSGVEYRTGKGMRLDKKSLRQLKQKIQQYQILKYPELSKSIVKHGGPPKEQALRSEKEYQCRQRTGRATEREQVSTLLKNCYENATSKNDFFNKLIECGISTYIRGGKISGVVYENKKYRFKGLGITEERITALDKSVSRQRELGELREKKSKSITRQI